MGKKKGNAGPQNHLQQSMGQMVSKAALAQMGPAIDATVRQYVQNLGNQLAQQQASTLETLFSRVVVMERLLMEKFGITADDLATKVADLEDEKEGLESVSAVESGDVVRMVIKTKTKDQTEFQGESRLKLYGAGTGKTIGEELESALIGMATGDVKHVEFGKDKALVAEMTINRVSRPVKEESKEQSNGEVQG